MRMLDQRTLGGVSGVTLSFAILLFVSCTRHDTMDTLKTYPVAGHVVDRHGNPVRQGAVEFRSADDVALQAVAELDHEGAFRLSTFVREGTRRRCRRRGTSSNCARHGRLEPRADFDCVARTFGRQGN